MLSLISSQRCAAILPALTRMPEKQANSRIFSHVVKIVQSSATSVVILQCRVQEGHFHPIAPPFPLKVSNMDLLSRQYVFYAALIKIGPLSLTQAEVNNLRPAYVYSGREDAYIPALLRHLPGSDSYRVVNTGTGGDDRQYNQIDNYGRSLYLHRDEGALPGGGKKGKKSGHSSKISTTTQTNTASASSVVTVSTPVLREYILPPPGAPGFFQSGAIHRVGEDALAIINSQASAKNQMDKKELISTINGTMQMELPVDTKIAYKGCAAVIQVQRWIASTLLMLNDNIPAIKNTERYTPEIQSGLVGEQLIIGSNAQNDSHMLTMMTDFFNQPLNLPTVKITGDKKADIKYSQRARHPEQLYEFVNNNAAFKVFLRKATSGCDAAESAQTTIFLDNLRTALQNNNIRIAPVPAGSAGEVHAEQKVIEYIQAQQKSLYEQCSDTLRQQGVIPVYLSGSKSPCGFCDALEKYRHVSSLPQSGECLFKIVRYEDPTTDPLQHSVGNIFPGNYAEADGNFHDGLEKFMAENVNTAGQNREFNYPNSSMYSRLNSVQ